MQRRSPVVLKTAPDQWVATIEEVRPRADLLPEWQAAVIKDIHGYLDRLGKTPAGPELLIYHQDEFHDTELAVEAGVVLQSARQGNKSAQKDMDDRIRVRVLPGASQLAASISTEPGLLSETYAYLTHWTQTNGFRPIGPWRELTYLQRAPDPQRVIEVQRPVMEAIQYYQPLEVKQMEPKIITKPAFTMVGLPYFGKNENQEIHQLWGQFNRRMEQLGSIKNDTAHLRGLRTSWRSGQPGQDLRIYL